MRNGFVFCVSFAEQINLVPDEEERAKLRNAIIEYGLYGTDPEFDYPLIATFTPIKEAIDRETNMFDRSAENGKKSGRKVAVIEDDWRIGALEEYLSRFNLGDVVCVRQIKREALSPNLDQPQDPTPKESQEISIMMNKFPEWVRTGRIRIADYGQQRCWRKEQGGEKNTCSSDELPFQGTMSVKP